MAYRKPYYRKNGTYVSGSFDSRNNRQTPTTGNNGTDAKIALIVLFVISFLAYKCNSYIETKREKIAIEEYNGLIQDIK